MTTTVPNKEDAPPAADNPFPVLPGNEGLDGSVEGAEAEKAEVTAEDAPEVEGEVEVAPETEDGAEAAVETDPNAAKADPEKPVKLWAERYKSPEELEIAYKHSSAEGKRLAGRVKEIEAGAATKVTELSTRIAELEMQVQLGPEIPELTDEQLEAMGPVKAARALQKQTERKVLAAKLKETKEAREKAQKKWEEDVDAHNDQWISKMKGDPENYPDYEALLPDMSKLADLAPWAVGNPNSAELLYYASFGRRALANVKGAKAKTKESADKAKLKAQAAGDVTAAPGAGGGTKDPAAAKKTPKPGSDEDVNLGMQKAWARKNPQLI